MRVLITGITGFIGGSFGRYAGQAGHDVMGTGRFSHGGKEWLGLYTPVTGAPDLSNLIRDFSPDVVLNAAGTASVTASLEDPLSDFHGSVQTCAEVLEAVRRSGNQPLIVIPSSAAVYGNPAVLPVSEEATLQPISPYGFHKAAAELLGREYAECFGLRVMICRFFSVFGFAQRRLLVWELYKQFAGREPTVWLEGTGEETRDFLYIDDLGKAVLGLVEQAETRSGDCVIVNVASGIETGVVALAEKIRDLVAPEKKILCRGNLRKNDPLRWCAEVSRLQTLQPAWRPRPLNEGLAACIGAWQQQSQHEP